MNFDDLKTNIVNLLKIYRGRGVSLRNEIHPLLSSFTFLDRIHTWSSLFVHISELEEDVEPDLLSKLGDLYTKIQADFNKRVLFEDKYLSVYKGLPCYDQLKQHLESLISPDQTLDLSRNGDFKDHIFQAKQEVAQKHIYQFKIIRTFILKENIRVDALKSEYVNEEYEKLVAYKEVRLPCFDSIILDDATQEIILCADLSSQFHEENLRGALAKLRLYLNQLVVEHIPDTGCNVFPAIGKLYHEAIGNVKNLSFKTDDGISHNESSRVGIEDLRSGEYHKGGIANATIEPYNITKEYSLETYKVLVTVKGSWHALAINTGIPNLNNFYVSTKDQGSFFKAIEEIVKTS
ncbi:MAG: hypothetical protein GAK29_02664 [Acinetobacter bereziniae]|uniref:Uncharacterized protein n=1 Tax=Acinetobacter bereziniae TaxID=106648 RepID=A0A833PFK0_ACIBZ|nr:MAG: hypothetical protein GAK29_02664 [Acinetobacter bereziniae]